MSPHSPVKASSDESKLAHPTPKFAPQSRRVGSDGRREDERDLFEPWKGSCSLYHPLRLPFPTWFPSAAGETRLKRLPSVWSGGVLDSDLGCEPRLIPKAKRKRQHRRNSGRSNHPYRPPFISVYSKQYDAASAAPEPTLTPTP